MNTILVYFAIPLSTILLSAILETFINCPIKVSGIFFSIFIVIAAVFGATIELFFLATIYTIISFTTSFLVYLINNRCNYFCNQFNNSIRINTINNSSNLLSERNSEKCECIQSANFQNSLGKNENSVSSDSLKDYSYFRKYR